MNSKRKPTRKHKVKYVSEPSLTYMFYTAHYNLKDEDNAIFASILHYKSEYCLMDIVMLFLPVFCIHKSLNICLMRNCYDYFPSHS